MMKKMNKKGIGFVFILVLGVVFLVLSIFAGFFGLKLLQKTINEVGLTTLIGAGAFVLALAFRQPLIAIIMALLDLIKSIFMFIRSLI